jgi:hypothetical protein
MFIVAQPVKIFSAFMEHKGFLSCIQHSSIAAHPEPAQSSLQLDTAHHFSMFNFNVLTFIFVSQDVCSLEGLRPECDMDFLLFMLATYPVGFSLLGLISLIS